MAYTNRTTLRRLPQYTNNDKPTWLGDVNETNMILENELNDANNKIADLTAQLATVNARLSKAGIA